jgi:hypothetical protein
MTTENHVDPLVVLDRNREHTTALRNLLAGRDSFLVGGGPSTKQLDMPLLKQRGIWTMAINNMAGSFHANSFVCSDPPSKFHDGIWLDPTIMKFVPVPKLCHKGRGHIRTKLPNGEFNMRQVGERIMCTVDCPNTWGFGRKSWWSYDDTFFTDDHAAWGNGGPGSLRTGNPKTFNTLLLGIRLLYYLGSRRIFLVGVDFNMGAGGYSFDQGRTQAAIENNNSQYSVTNAGLCEMVSAGVFNRFGLQIFNCNQNSGLRAFPYAPFVSAVRGALKDFPPTPLDLAGWYEKGPTDK